MTGKLTEAQKRILEDAMRNKGFVFGGGSEISEFYSLEHANLVVLHRADTMMYRLTPAGRAALAEHKGTEGK